MPASESRCRPARVSSVSRGMKESYNPLSRIIPGAPAQADAWKEACRVTQWLKERYPGCTVRAFGSLVRPNAWSPRSDIDLAISGVPDFSWQNGMQVHDEFTKFEVQVVSTDDPSDTSPKDSGSAREFIEEILTTGVELPAPFKVIPCKPELVMLADRLGMVANNMREELQVILEVDSMGIPSSVKASVVRAYVVRYRLRLEKGLSRVLGFIDRLKVEYEEGEDRLRLYETAMQDVPGLRPPLLTPAVAMWHANFVREEYALADEDEVVAKHRQFLAEIHRQTLASFQAFREFLLVAAGADAGTKIFD